MIIGVYTQDKKTKQVSKNPIIDQEELVEYLSTHHDVTISHMLCDDNVTRIVLRDWKPF